MSTLKKKRQNKEVANQQSVTFCRGHPRYRQNRSPSPTAALLHDFNYIISHLQLSGIHNRKRLSLMAAEQCLMYTCEREQSIPTQRTGTLLFKHQKCFFGLITYHELICCQELYTHNKGSVYLLLLLLFHFLLYCSFESFYLFRDTEKIPREEKEDCKQTWLQQHISDTA